MSTWRQARSGDRLALDLVVQAEAAEAIMDRVEEALGDEGGFRVLVCVNLAASATFLLQGVRPSNWWEAARAGRLVRLGLLLWLALLLALSLLVVLSQYGERLGF